MATLKQETKSGIDISAGEEVLSYTYAGASPIMALARVTMGDATKPIVGGGVYAIETSVNGIPHAPVSQAQVQAGDTKAFVQSRHVILETGDTISIVADGLPADIDVNTYAVLMDATPAQATDLAGTGAIVVNHDYGGTDALRYVYQSVGVADATIQAFNKADYVAGNRGAAYVVAQSQTNSLGRWVRDMMLNPGTYTLVFFKISEFGPDTREIEVTA